LPGRVKTAILIRMRSKQLDDALEFMRRNAVPVTATVAERRRILDARAENLPMLPGVALDAVTVNGRRAEWVSVDGAPADVVMLHIHGGGYVAGSVEGARDLAARLCKAAGARGLSIDYRLAPEHPFPAGVEDCLSFYRWLLDRGTDPARIAVVGGSSGGGLTAATVLAARGAGLPLPGCAVCLSPFVDMTVSSAALARGQGADVMDPGVIRSFARHYLQGQDPRLPLASPVFADWTGMPPLLIQAGSVEVLLDDARELRDAAAAGGCAVTYTEWEDMFHGWHAFVDLPECARAMAEAGAFIRRHCAPRRA
jgi:epsilon-lactone hydrolase